MLKTLRPDGKGGFVRQTNTDPVTLLPGRWEPTPSPTQDAPTGWLRRMIHNLFQEC